MTVNQRWALFSFLIVSILVVPVHADFGVMDSTKPAEPYGNAQSESFHRAITGGTRLTATEEAELSEELPVRETQHYYARVGLNFSTLKLEQLKNVSLGLDSSGVVAKKSVSMNQTGLEIALGYGWSSNLRGEIEYLANKNLNYDASPVVTGAGLTSRQLTAQIKNNTLLANVYYEFLGLNRFKPYVTVGLGPSLSSVQATITAAPYDAAGSATLRKTNIAMAFGGGLRVAMFSHWHIDIRYRYMRLGQKLKFAPTSGFALSGSSNMNAVSLGLMYYF